MKDLKKLCEEILASIQIIEETEATVNRNIAEGVHAGMATHEISKTTMSGYKVMGAEYGKLRESARSLYALSHAYYVVHGMQHNGKPQQYDTTSPIQEHEANEMDAIRSTARFEVTAIVSPAQEAA